MKYLIAVFLIVVAILSLFNLPLAVALVVLAILAGGTVFVLWKAGIHRKEIAIVFLIVLAIYLASTIFIHYTQFYPFGGRDVDQWWYNKAAVEISSDFRHGDFSSQHIAARLAENYSASYFPVLLAVLYTITMPEEIIGDMFVIWLVALSALLLYALSLELGVSRKFAFWVGISPIFYPSFLYWGSMLLRESTVVSLVLLSCLLMVKMQKRFSFALFLLFYCALGALVHFRFYTGYVILFVFPFSLFFLSSLNWAKKLQYALFIIPLLGFLPQISGHGYYGIIDIRHFTQPQTIVVYREYVPAARLKEIKEATPPPIQTPPVQTPAVQTPVEQKAKEVVAPTPQPSKNLGSTIAIKAGVDNPVMFVKNYLISFSFMLVGPFPWHIRYARQLFVLLEMIPWWIAFLFLLKGIVSWRTHRRTILPIILVSMGILAELALILNTYGTYMRIRMPVFLLLFALLPFAFQKKEEIKSI